MSQRHAPATGRNRSYILEILSSRLPANGTVLEVASGSGEHAIYFAPPLAPRVWLPTDISTENLASIEAWRAAYPSANLQSPQFLDAQSAHWPVENETTDPPLSAVVNINMIHITAWSCCEGLLAGCGRVLPPGGLFYLYGPFMRDGKHTAPSNEAFDANLKRQNPEWGVRNLESVLELAASHGLDCQEVIEMPANNLSVIFERRQE